MQLALPTTPASNLNPSWLPELAGWPTHPDLVALDLSLTSRNRVSALPWRGQFSPETVSRLLSVVATSGDQVLDPFVGSGTTLIEAARRGLSSIGFDVNPAAVALARAALWASLPEADRRTKFALLRSDAEALVGPTAPNASPLPSSEITDLHAAILLGGGPSSVLAGLARLETLIESLPSTPTDVVVGLSDARCMPLASDAVDVVVTSPPYINVFNYHQYGRPFTDAFGWPVLSAARSEIGSNRQNRQNRFRTVVQYSVDMALALTEIRRILRPNGSAVVVVGRQSRVRGVPFFNGDILAQIVSRLGLFHQRLRGERVFVSRFGQHIWEDVLVLSGKSRLPCVGSRVLDVGMSVGKDALLRSRDQPDADIEAIDAAIDEAMSIGASPLASRAG